MDASIVALPGVAHVDEEVWETVREDYLLSNAYRAEEIEGRLAKLREMAAAAQALPLRRWTRPATFVTAWG
ncbi:MAG: hypothetical protein V3R71_05165 [Gemmatimonadales bacterium]